jgi:hypothetical protein
MGDATPDALLDVVKACTKCHQVKPLTAFSRGGDRYGRKWHCQACNVKAVRAWRELPGNRVRLDRGRRNSRLRRDYGINIDRFEQMVEDQEGRCAICGNPPTAKGLHVDHHHDSGIVRALLCGPCNMGLGQFRDDPAILRAAADYLERHAGSIDGDLWVGL